MAVKWKNEWNNESYLNATSMYTEETKKSYTKEDAQKDKNNAFVGYYSGGGFSNMWKWIGDLFTGFTKSKSHNAEQENNIRQVTNAKTDLTDQYNQYVEKLNLGNKNLATNLNTSNSLLQNSANTTIENRDNALNYSASFISEQRNLNNIQMRELGVQNTQSENALVQRVALSGFRNTGTMNNIVEEQQRVNRINESIKRQAFQMDERANLESAKNSYVNGTYSAYGSMDSIESNMQKYEQTLGENALQTKQNKETYDKEMQRYNEDLNAIRTSGKLSRDAGIASGVFGLLDFGLNFTNAFLKPKSTASNIIGGLGSVFSKY